MPYNNTYVSFSDSTSHVDADIKNKKMTIQEMCKLKKPMNSEIIRNLLSLNLSLMKVLLKNNLIKEEELSEEFEYVKKYTDLVKDDSRNFDEEEKILREVVGESLIDLPEFLKGDL